MFGTNYTERKEKKGHKNKNYRPDTLFGNNANKHYFDNLKRVIEGRKALADSYLFRKRAKEAEDRRNYQMELDRIQGILSRTRATKKPYDLSDREKELVKLGAKIQD